jgi:hypothetical protein
MLRSVAPAAIAAIGLTAGFGLTMGAAQAASTYSAPLNYGVAVDSSGKAIKDFSPSDKYIDFYIPLDSAETYGYKGGGLSSDTCTDRGGCDGGSLTMLIKYTPIAPGPAIISFDFTDLDLKGVNDPFGFFESVEFFYKGSSVAKVDEKTDTQVKSANVNRQLIQIVLGEVLSPFTVKLVLKTKGDIDKYMVNTPEKLKTWMTTPAPVPLPAALPLFGTGLAVMGAMRWRRARTLRNAIRT